LSYRKCVGPALYIHGTIDAPTIEMVSRSNVGPRVERRRLDCWHTEVDAADEQPGQRFSFVVQAMGGDWTQWAYLIESGSIIGVTRPTEVVRMCVPLPLGAVLFERLLLSVRERGRDLQGDLAVPSTGSAPSSRPTRAP
jgi:hypothetical protein